MNVMKRVIVEFDINRMRKEVNEIQKKISAKKKVNC